MELNLEEIRARAEQYAKRYPWRLAEGAKDFLPRDRAALLAEVERLRKAPDIDTLAGWADWFEHNSSHVGGKPVFTADEVASLLRGKAPFGTAQAVS